MISSKLQSLIAGGLRELLAGDGASRYLESPLIEPNGEFFPDAWSPDQGGVHRLLRRIMFHAGLGDVPLEIDRFVFEADDAEDGPQRGGRHVIAYFDGQTDGVCKFGINCTQLDDPEYLIGVLAHEVAHAYRSIHGLVVEDSDEEEDLTDLTTVFLGFGIFTTNNALQSTISGYEQRVRRAGYLSSDAMAFALATWVRARGIASDRGIIERWIEPGQASTFAKVMSELTQERIRERLGVASAGVAEKPIPAMLDDAPAASPSDEPIDFAAKRSDTFRVLVRPQKQSTWMGLATGGLIAFTQGWTTFDVVAFALIGAICGYGIGRFLAHDDCARRDCEWRIPAKAANCPRCGSAVQGSLTDAAKLDDALDELRRKRVAARRRM